MKLTRERQEQTGAFYTPKVWADLAVKYILAVIPNPEDYIFYDPAAGEGALLDALPANCKKVATTLEAGDVEILKAKGYKNAFQFDFLNDSLEYDYLASDIKFLPLLRVLMLNHKVIILTNPPYNHLPASDTSFAKLKYKENKAVNLFFYRIIYELKPMMLCSFNKMDIWQAAQCGTFRKNFNPYVYLVKGINLGVGNGILTKKEWADYCKSEWENNDEWIDPEDWKNQRGDIGNGLFLTPSKSWPGLKGQFPIAFNMFWVGDDHEFQQENKKNGQRNT
jgi:hypothetical protein